MDGVEEEGRGSQGKRNLDVRGQGEDSHGDGEPLPERGFYHTNDYALLPRHCYFRRQLLLVQRELPLPPLSSTLFLFLRLSLPSAPPPSLPLSVFFYSSLDCRRAKLGYYRAAATYRPPLHAPLISSSVFLLLVRFPCLSLLFSSVFRFVFLSSCFFASLRCSG